jgi:hypothetical protein
MSEIKSRQGPTLSNLGSGRFAKKYTTEQAPILENIKDNIRYILLKDGECKFFTTEQYQKFNIDNNSTWKKSQLIDVSNQLSYLYDSDGAQINAGGISMDLIDEIFNKAYLVDEGKEELKVEKETKELTFDDMLNLLYRPNFYFNDIPAKKDNMNLLIKKVLLFPENFDEIFAVEVPPPSSPLMKSYLENLSVLINVELKDKQEIDNIEDLQKKAYDQSDYIGKTFETVLEEAKDFGDYLRYLLNKGEKLIVTQDQKEYAFILRKLISKNGEINLDNIKSKSLDKKVYFNAQGFKNFHISVIIDQQFNDSARKSNRLFLHVPDITELEIYLEHYKYDLKAALIFNSNGYSVDLFVSDANYNHGLFTIKSATMNKWTRKLEGVTPKLNNIINEEMTFPYNVSKSI